jgi:hypothetical protein
MRFRLFHPSFEAEEKIAELRFTPSRCNMSRCAKTGREQMQQTTRADERLLDHFVGDLLKM